jgi:hypothetical protein
MDKLLLRLPRTKDAPNAPRGTGKSHFSTLKVRLHYRAKSMLDLFARRVFDKFAPSKAAISAFLLAEFARRANSSPKLGTLLDSVNAP